MGKRKFGIDGERGESEREREREWYSHKRM